MSEKYASYDPDGEGLVFHETLEQATESAKTALSDPFDEGWPEQATDICILQVLSRVQETDRREIDPESSHEKQFSHICDYRLLPLEPTRPTVAEVLAKVEEMVAEADSAGSVALSDYVQGVYYTRRDVLIELKKFIEGGKS